MLRRPSDLPLFILGMVGLLMVAHMTIIAVSLHYCKTFVTANPTSTRCNDHLGVTTQDAAESYMAVLLALLIPIQKHKDDV
jgi:hypothetical protein